MKNTYSILALFIASIVQAFAAQVAEPGTRYLQWGEELFKAFSTDKKFLDFVETGNVRAQLFRNERVERDTSDGTVRCEYKANAVGTLRLVKKDSGVLHFAVHFPETSDTCDYLVEVDTVYFGLIDSFNFGLFCKMALIVPEDR